MLPLLVLLRHVGAGVTPVAMVLVLVTIQIVCLRWIRSAGAILAVIAAGLVAWPVVDLHVAVASVVLSMAWTWSLGVRPKRSGAVSSRSVAGLAVVVSALTVFGAPILFTIVLGVVLVLVAGPIEPPAWTGAGIRVGDRLGSIAATALGGVAMLVPAVVMSVLSVAYRCVGHHPLGSRRGGWVSRAGRADAPSPRGAAHPGADRSSRQIRRSLAHVLLVVVLIVAGLAAYTARATTVPTSAAFADDPSWPTVWREQSAFNSNPRFDNTTLFGLKDFRSRFVNQVDHVRRTWRPPPCACRRFTVWWFGGSAAWGFYQRDDDTIPSQIARALWDEGVAVDFVNLAVPGYSLFQEAQQFNQMAVTVDPPDLAVFYDGANELALQVNRNNEGRGADESPASYMEQQMASIFRVASMPSRLMNRGQGTVPADPDLGDQPPLDSPEVAAHAMNRYRRQVEIVRVVAAARQIPTMFLWQPTMSTAPRATVAQFDPMAAPDFAWYRRLVDAARARLPSGVVDLSDVMDRERRPIFPDWAHTNRHGSNVVAGALAPGMEDFVRSGARR